MRPLFSSQKINALKYSDDFITLDHHCRIRYLRGLVDSLVCESARPAHNANTTLLVDVARHDS
jgi:hypothetical protein